VKIYGHVKEKDGKTSRKCPKIQRLVTPLTLQRKRHRRAIKRERINKACPLPSATCVFLFCVVQRVSNHNNLVVHLRMSVLHRVVVHLFYIALCTDSTASVELPSYDPEKADPYQPMTVQSKAEAQAYHKLLMTRLKEQRERRSESLAKKRAIRQASQVSSCKFRCVDFGLIELCVHHPLDAPTKRDASRAWRLSERVLFILTSFVLLRRRRGMLPWHPRRLQRQRVNLARQRKERLFCQHMCDMQICKH
jgi:hypothetical protein